MLTIGADDLLIDGGSKWGAGSLYYRLNADLPGANVNTVQSLFGVSVSLSSSTVYSFEGVYALTKTLGATSHLVSFLFGGTATVNNILYTAIGGYRTTATTTTGPLTLGTSSNGMGFITNTAASTSVNSTGYATASISLVYLIRGTVSINAGGTFTPQYILSAAPGGAYSTLTGSYIKFAPIAAAGVASSQGAWS